MEPPKKRKSTFIVQISSCQNASWQGTVTWADGKQTVPFRSALELIKLMDSAVERYEEPKENELSSTADSRVMKGE